MIHYLLLIVSSSFLLSMEPEPKVFDDTAIVLPAFSNNDRALSITTSPDGEKILVGSGEKAHALKLYDVTKMKEVGHYASLKNITRINAISCTTDQDHPWRVAVGDHDATIIDIRSGKQELIVDGSHRRLYKLTLTGDQLSAFREDGKRSQWDLRKPEAPCIVEDLPYSSLYGCDYHENKGWVVGRSTPTSPITSTITRYAPTNEPISKELEGPVYTVAFSKKGPLVAASVSLFSTAPADNRGKKIFKSVPQIILYKTSDLSAIQSLTSADRIDSITFAPKLAYLAAASYDGTVCLWKKK